MSDIKAKIEKKLSIPKGKTQELKNKASSSGTVSYKNSPKKQEAGLKGDYAKRSR